MIICPYIFLLFIRNRRYDTTTVNCFDVYDKMYIHYHRGCMLKTVGFSSFKSNIVCEMFPRVSPSVRAPVILLTKIIIIIPASNGLYGIDIYF